jgi:hypothetical protein
MSITLEDAVALEELEKRLKEILPALYSDSYEDIQPVSMRSAPLKYDLDGNVAWNEIWASFCDLAMAGGPPHRGTLLQPASSQDIGAASEEYGRVVTELCRGVSLVTGLPAEPSRQSGWIEVHCHSAGMAAWLVRAIVMENVMSRHEKATLFLPAGPAFRLNKEIKNVITTIAKTTHYWLEHTPAEQKQSIEAIFAEITSDNALLEPALESEVISDPDTYRNLLDTIATSLDLPCFKGRYPGWIGVECPSVRKAVWIMRALVTENILARRENEVLFLPVSARSGALGSWERLIRSFSRLYHLCTVARV